MTACITSWVQITGVQDVPVHWTEQLVITASRGSVRGRASFGRQIEDRSGSRGRDTRDRRLPARSIVRRRCVLRGHPGSIESQQHVVGMGTGRARSAVTRRRGRPLDWSFDVIGPSSPRTSDDTIVAVHDIPTGTATPRSAGRPARSAEH